MADDANLVRAAHILSSERCAVGQRPFANIEVTRRFSVNPCEPVLISSRYLGGGNNFFAYRDYTRHFAPNRVGVFNFQGAGASPAGTNAARCGAARENQNHIFSKAGDLRFYLRLRAVADADHGDHRADADDDTKRSQHRTHFVSAQRAIGDVKRRCDSHLVREKVEALKR